MARPGELHLPWQSPSWNSVAAQDEVTTPQQSAILKVSCGNNYALKSVSPP
jgi:hypothetical protein